eukprot:TRINITY_DN33778_c0_g1_i1.p1 TRINITY_DN33778_c0_g1~~TRINITY_DN33778_c0_g1_i1.p1  ORF type:complete len:599 (+),score=68.62 TRINITY_DN33778_c0_g1_i1:109-1905(+)
MGDAASPPGQTATRWVENATTDVCMNCHARFGIMQLRRKHHCRKCGKVVCSACSRDRQTVPEYNGLQRVCDGCSLTRSSARPSEVDEQVAETAAAAVAAGEKVKPLLVDALHGVAVPSGDDRQREFGTLQVQVIEAKGLVAADFNLVGKNSSDPYCVLQVYHGHNNGPKVRTKTIKVTLEPRWNATFSFRISRPNSVLRLEVWDADKLDKDDIIGILELPLAEVPGCSGSQPLRGWVPLRLPEAQNLPGESTPRPARGAGAVLIEVSLRDVQPASHLWAYASPLPQAPAPLPRFDIDAVYGPIMHMVDLLWTRCISPILFWLLGIIFWSQPLHSLAALVAWNVGARWFLSHYPACAPLGLALYMFSFSQFSSQGDCDDSPKAEKKSARTLVRQKTSPALLESEDSAHQAATTTSASGAQPQDMGSKLQEHEEYEESQLGSAVQKLAFVLPRWLKDMLRGFQPTLRSTADGLQMVHDIFVWDHDASPYVAVGLLCFAVLCELLRFDVLLMLVGSVILLAFSPLMPAVTGTIAYLHWTRAKGQPHAWEMAYNYDEAWSSKDYRRDHTEDFASSRQPNRLIAHAHTLGNVFSKGSAGKKRD